MSGKLTIANPGGYSLTVNVLSQPGGSVVPVFSDQALTQATTVPFTTSAASTSLFATSGAYLLSVKTAGVELATESGAQRVVNLNEEQPWVHTVQPTAAQLASIESAQSGQSPTQSLAPGPPVTAGTIAGQVTVDSNGITWYWTGTQWQLGGTGIEIGYADSTANYALTTTFAVPPGMVAGGVTVPPGVDVEVEAYFPWVLNGATGSNSTGVWVSLYEDTTLLKTEIVQFSAANVSDHAECKASYSPSSAGLHTYSVQIKQNTTATATAEAGLQAGLLVSPYLRVKTC